MTLQRPILANSSNAFRQNLNVQRVGIMAPLNADGDIDLCDRWAKPFADTNIDVVTIPVGTSSYKDVLDTLDGLLLPGGHSMIHPSFYTAVCTPVEELYDRDRDAYAMDLISYAFEIDLPLLGICRGMQEMVVAFGGHIEILPIDEIEHGKGYEFDGDHKGMDKPVHKITIESEGVLAQLFGAQSTLYVNSIHKQGITKAKWEELKDNKPFDQLCIEALAPDGVVEAVSAKNKAFFLGLQPHFEFQGPQHDTVFSAFRGAIRDHYVARSRSAAD